MPFDIDPRYEPLPEGGKPERRVLRRQRVTLDVKVVMVILALILAGLLSFGTSVLMSMYVVPH